jgi:hypothetical protein
MELCRSDRINASRTELNEENNRLDRYPKIIVATLIIILFIGEFAHCRPNSSMSGGKVPVRNKQKIASVSVSHAEPLPNKRPLQIAHGGVK